MEPRRGPKSESQTSVMRQLSPYMMLGSQLTVTILFVGAVGYFVDEKMDSEPWGLAIGLMAGCVIGFIQFFRSIQRLLKRDQQK